MRRKLLRWILVSCGVLVFLTLLAAIFTREGRFITRAAIEEVRILLARRPILEAAADTTLPQEWRDQLHLMLEVRDFADSVVGLKAGDSYKSFAQVRKDTLLLVLSASPQTRLEFHTWWYPIAGTIPYKGFFDFDQALEEERRLADRGYDTQLRTASAFSTLGWFEDPLLSTALGRDARLTASTVVHELAHNTIYVPGNTLFNESFASFAGYFGAAAFFEARGDSAAASWLLDVWHDERVLELFYASVRDSAEALYSSDLPDSIKLERREQVFGWARESFRAEVGEKLRLYSGEGLAQREMNNATLMAAGIYRDRLDRFEALLEAHGGNLATAVAALVDALSERSGDPYEVLESLIGQ